MTRWERLDDIDRMRADDATYWQNRAAEAYEQYQRHMKAGRKLPATYYQISVARCHEAAWKNLERLIP